MEIITAKISSNESRYWSQVLEFAKADHNLFLYLGFVDLEESAAERKSKAIASFIESQIIKQAKKLTGADLKEISKAARLHFKFSDNDDFAIIVIQEGVLKVTAGGLTMFLLRDGKMATIFEPKTHSGTISGPIKEGDSFMVVTTDIVSGLGIGVIKALLEMNQPASAIESLLTKLSTLDGNLRKGCLLAMSVASKTKVADSTILEPSQKTALSRLKNLFNLFRKAAVAFVDLLLKLLPERKIVVEAGMADVSIERKRKSAFFVAVVLLVLLVVSVVYGSKQRELRSKKAATGSAVDEINHLLDEAQALFGLSPDRSRELVLAAKESLSDLADIDGEEYKVMAEKVDEVAGAILGEYEGQPELFLDLTLSTDGFSGQAGSLSEDTLYVLDKENSKLIQIDVKTKNTRVIAGPSEVEGTLDVAGYLDKAFIAKKDVLYKVDKGGITKLADGQFGNDVLINAYAGNIYLLDKSRSQILRYQGGGGGFGEGESWLAEGLSEDLTNIVSWAINGSIWAVDGEAMVYRFASGRRLSRNTISKYVKKPAKISTSENDQDIYFLDSATNKIVVFDKEYGYIAQYSAGDVGPIRSMFASESVGKIFLLTGPKLYVLKMKHLN